MKAAGKGLLAVIGLGKSKAGDDKHGDEDTQEEEDSESDDESKQEELEASEGMLAAVKENDAQAFADHLKAFLSACGAY